MNPCISRKTQKHTFLLVPGGHICDPQRVTNMASPIQSLINLGEMLMPEYLAYELSHRSDSWRDFLYIYSLSFLDALY